MKPRTHCVQLQPQTNLTLYGNTHVFSAEFFGQRKDITYENFERKYCKPNLSLNFYRYLFRRGCTLNLRNAPTTPLQVAIENDHTEIAGILLQNGHDPNFSPKHCDIPLFEAIKHNRPAIGEF